MVDQHFLNDRRFDAFRAVADATYDWESLLDMGGRPLWINPAVERLTGYTVAECLALSRYPLDLIASNDAEMFAQLIQGAILGSVGNDVEFQVVCKDGSRKWFAVSWQPLRDARNTPRGIRLSKRDISDRKAIEDALRKQTHQLEELANARAQRIVDLEQRRLHMQKLAALGNMAGALAHEINNPLAGIKNALRLIRGREQLKSANLELLELVDKEITRIAGLISQMRQLCRPSISSPEVVDVVKTINEVIAIVGAQFETKHVTFEKPGWPLQLHTILREPEVKQIMHNLLLNACEASPVGGNICITLETIQDWLTIRVQDSGQGIPEEMMAMIFEPFRASRYESGRSGLGLGLSISNSLADALGGGLEVSSPPGKGATFTFKLPYCPQP